MMAEMREKVGLMVRSQLPPDQLEAIADLAGRALERRRDAPSLSALDASDREEELADWLEDHGVSAAWDVAPTLVAAGVDLAWLEELAEALPPPKLEIGLSYPVRALESDALLDEITDAAGRISAIISRSLDVARAAAVTGLLSSCVRPAVTVPRATSRSCRATVSRAA